MAIDVRVGMLIIRMPYIPSSSIHDCSDGTGFIPQSKVSSKNGWTTYTSFDEDDDKGEGMAAIYGTCGSVPFTQHRGM